MGAFNAEMGKKKNLTHIKNIYCSGVFDVNKTI